LSTPAKDRFFKTVMETIKALEFNCLQLAQDVRHFHSVKLTHSMTIIIGMVMSILKNLIVNKVELKNSLPKGVLSHGQSKKRRVKRAAAHK